jgi:para-aminobenzoate synthetase component 1
MAYFQVGGGIVWDSKEESEYIETLDKAKALMNALRH